jgi:hypothetical protein
MTQQKLNIGMRIRIGAQRTLLKGGPGSGKTHLLSEFERSFFLPVESGTTGFSPSYACHFFESEEGVPTIPRSFAALIEMLKLFIMANVLADGASQRPYAHLMIDSVSAVEDLIHAEVCRQNGARSMEDADYGPKLYYATVPLWRQFLAAVDTVVTQSGANVWLTGHTEETSAANQAGETFRKTTLRIKATGKVQDDIRSLITQAFDNDWLLSQQITVKRGGRGQRTVALAGGRIVLTQPGDTPGGGSYEAKSRIRVPERIPATQEDIRAAMKAGVTRPPKRIKIEIEALLKKLPEEQRAIIVADLTRGDSAGWLDRTLARAKALLVAAEAEQAEDAPDEPEQKPVTTTPAVEPVAEKKAAPQHEPEQRPATTAPAATTTPAVEPREGESEAMAWFRGELAKCLTKKSVGELAVAASKDKRFTNDERTFVNSEIQRARGELP